MTRVGSILTEYSAQMLQSLRTISTEVIELMLPFLNFPVSFWIDLLTGMWMYVYMLFMSYWEPPIIMLPNIRKTGWDGLWSSLKLSCFFFFFKSQVLGLFVINLSTEGSKNEWWAGDARQSLGGFHLPRELESFQINACLSVSIAMGSQAQRFLCSKKRLNMHKNMKCMC